MRCSITCGLALIVVLGFECGRGPQPGAVGSGAPLLRALFDVELSGQTGERDAGIAKKRQRKDVKLTLGDILETLVSHDCGRGERKSRSSTARPRSDKSRGDGRELKGQNFYSRRLRLEIVW